MARRVTKVRISDKNAVRRMVGDIRTQIHNIGVASQGQSVENALFAAAKPIQDEAKDIVARDTNHLAMGISRVRMRVNRAGQIARVGVTVKNPPNAKMVAQRWHWEEYGTSKRKKPLNPYFRPAFEKTQAESLRVFERRLAQNYAKALRGKLRLNKNWRPGDAD